MQKRFKKKTIGAERLYTTKELAKTIGACEASVRIWYKSGKLPSVTGGSSPLFLGRDAKAFLRLRDQSGRIKLQEDEFYCMRCKAARRIGSDEATSRKIVTGSVLVSGRCSICSAKLTRAFSPKSAALAGFGLKKTNK